MAEKTIQEFNHVSEEANGGFNREWRDEVWGGNHRLSVVAQQAALDEKSMTIRQALKVYRKAVMWSLIISVCVIMEGYDTNLLGNFYASVSCPILRV